MNITILNSDLIRRKRKTQQTLRMALKSISYDDVRTFVSLNQLIDEKLMKYFTMIKNYNAKVLNLSSKFVRSNFHFKISNNLKPSAKNVNLNSSLEALIKDNSLTLTELNSHLLKHYVQLSGLSLNYCFYDELISSTQKLISDYDINLIFKSKDDSKEEKYSLMKINLMSGKEKSRLRLSWDDFGGYHHVVSELKEISFFMKHFKEASKYTLPYKFVPAGILFYGPPGTGKTFLSRVFCDVNNLLCKSISASNIASTYSMGLTVNLSQEIDNVLRMKDNNHSYFSALYIDEVDSLLQKRGTTNSVERDTLVNVFNSYLDGPNHKDGLILLASTNRMDIIDSSLTRPKRFKVLEFKKPSKRDLIEIFKSQIRRRQRRSERLFYTEEFVDKLEGFVDAYADNEWTGAFVSEILDSLEKTVLIKSLRNNSPYVANYSDLIGALNF